jgi:hypothetical protein
VILLCDFDRSLATAVEINLQFLDQEFGIFKTIIIVRIRSRFVLRVDVYLKKEEK